MFNFILSCSDTTQNELNHVFPHTVHFDNADEAKCLKWLKYSLSHDYVFCELAKNKATQLTNGNVEYRNIRENWNGSNIFLVDIDDGLSLADFIEKYGKYQMVISTSRNHQKTKNGLTCDRYHVLFIASKKYDNIDEYISIYKQIVASIPQADKAVKDPTRLIFGNPNTEITIIDNDYPCYDTLFTTKQEATKEVAPATTNTNTSVPEVPAKRNAGRPKGSLNKKTVQSSKDEIEMMLSVINPTLEGHYDIWRSLVFAGHKEGMSEETMRNWSKGWLYAFSEHKTVSTYSDEAFDNLWSHITDESDDPNTYGTIKYYFDEAINEKLAHFPADDELTEFGQAKMLVKHYHKVLAYCYKIDWMMFIDGYGWQINEDAPSLVQEKLRIEQSKELDEVSAYLSEAKAKKLLKFKTQTQGGSFISKTTTLARGHLVLKKDDNILKFDDAFDADFSLALCPKGKVVNLFTGETFKVKPEHKLINKLGAVPDVSDDPEGAELWQQILEDIFVNKDKTPNKEYIKYFQLQIGGAMLRNNPRKQIHYLLGDGGNGKTFIMRILLAAFGDYGFKFNANDLTDGNQFTTSDLQHKMLLSVSEGSKGQKFTDGALKRFTETGTVRVERKGKQAEQAYASYTIFWDTNHAPITDDTGYATRSRQDVLPFYQQFDSTPEGNKRLEDMLSNHLSAVVKWMVDGAVMAHKLSCCFEQVKPAIVRDAVAEYQFSNDPIARYFADDDCKYEITGNSKDVVFAETFYLDYNQWFNMLGEDTQFLEFNKSDNKAKALAERVQATYCRKSNVVMKYNHGAYKLYGIAPKGKGHTPTGTDDDTSKGNISTSANGLAVSEDADLGFDTPKASQVAKTAPVAESATFDIPATEPTSTAIASATKAEPAKVEDTPKAPAKAEAKGFCTVSYAVSDVSDGADNEDNDNEDNDNDADNEVSAEMIHELHKQLDESEDDSFFAMPSIEQQEATVKQVEQTIKQKEIVMNNEQVAPTTSNEPHHFTSKGKQKDPNYEHEFWEAKRAEAMRKSEELADKQRVQAFSSPHFETDREHDPQYDAWCKEQGVCDDLPF